MSSSSDTTKNNQYEKCFCYKEDICVYFKHWNKDGLFSVADLTADISRHLYGLKIRLYKIPQLSVIFIFKIHIVFSILSRNSKICYFLNKILLSDLTLILFTLSLYKNFLQRKCYTAFTTFSFYWTMCIYLPL